MFDSTFAGGMIFTTSLSTASWLIVTMLTKPESFETLSNYYQKVRPAGNWSDYSNGLQSYDSILPNLFKAGIAMVCIVFALLGMGELFFGDVIRGISYLTGSVIGLWFVARGI